MARTARSESSPSPAAQKREARAKAKARAERAYFRHVERTYGITEEQYKAMFDAQEGRCAICRRVPRTRRLAVDHDHDTGRVRGLLCYLCNKYLGQWESDPIAAYSASQYLAEIAEDHVLRGSLVEPGGTTPS